MQYNQTQRKLMLSWRIILGHVISINLSIILCLSTLSSLSLALNSCSNSGVGFKVNISISQVHTFSAPFSSYLATLFWPVGSTIWVNGQTQLSLSWTTGFWLTCSYDIYMLWKPFSDITCSSYAEFVHKVAWTSHTCRGGSKSKGLLQILFNQPSQNDYSYTFLPC